MSDWLKDLKRECEKKAENAHFALFCPFFFERIRGQKNKKDKSVHAGHAASKSCVPDIKIACTGHAGTLYFQA